MTGSAGAPRLLRMGPDVMATLLGAGQDKSRERCGVLFGTVDAEGVAWTVGCAELENAAPDPSHTYAFDPEVQARVWQRVERAGHEVFGIWHTHPHGPTGLSATDVAHAQPWLLYVVVAQVPGDELGRVSVGVHALEDEAEHGCVTVPHEVVHDAGERAAAAGRAAAMRP